MMNASLSHTSKLKTIVYDVNYNTFGYNIIFNKFKR